ncbi:2-oxoglutarate-dependent dioxygenase AOP3-like [Quercus robur]|uniref:2-oxoglutarate-dependent dioxygenase AOP3-like n=1 Tax=Quercus robur TaxID=38942 RepID=UPI0021624B1F|nr:2-oxoglutarate-dependent dioxygenase AOP3-like [Quercus robur]
MDTKTQAKIPVVDLSNLDLKPGTKTWFSARKDVCRALEEYGCFVAEIGNKIPSELHNAISSSFAKLFEFPTETKMKFTSERPFHGYFSSPKYERLVIDNATSTDVTQEFTNIFWPNGNHHVRESADSYVKLMAELDKMVTKMVFENYGVGDYYDSHMESTTHSFGILKYNEPQKTGTKNGLDNHTDKHFTTILHQNRVKGLEIKTKDGEWIDFDPSPSSFIFLAGDGLQVWSNDRIKACMHRVLLAENLETRYSLGLFSHNNKTICVPEELVDEEHPLHYKPINLRDYAQEQNRLVAYGKELSLEVFCGV